VISAKDAGRVSAWVDEAVSSGARVVYGGGTDGRVVRPTVLADVRDDMKVFSTEVFGPVVSVRPFKHIDEALAGVNATPYGLAAGIFTASIANALQAANTLRVGTVHINETSSARVDLMPFGGVKASGEGHEGPAYAIREMTEERLITIGRP
jgi:succinate-semialdehyde dehydrogenase/glutarate-semialdehyde dehydrogenase